MSKSSLLIGVLLAAFAIPTTTYVAFAATAHAGHSASVAAQAGTPGHPPHCPSGQVAKWHTVSGQKQWHCVAG